MKGHGRGVHGAARELLHRWLNGERRVWPHFAGLVILEEWLLRGDWLVSDLRRLAVVPAAALVSLVATVQRMVVLPACLAVVCDLALRQSSGRKKLAPSLGWRLVIAAWVPHTAWCAVRAVASTVRGADIELARFTELDVLWAGAVAWAAMRHIAATQPDGAANFATTRSPRSAIIALTGALLAAGAMARGLQVTRAWPLLEPLLEGAALRDFVVAGVNVPQADTRQLRGRVLLIEFWATWCAPCVAAMPHMQHLHERLSGRGLHLMAIHAGTDADAKEVERFVREHALTLPVYRDTGALQTQFRVQSVPTTYLVDRQGKVRATYYGAPDAATLGRQVESLL